MTETAIVTTERQSLLADLRCEATPFGLYIPPNLSIEDWKAVGRDLKRVETAVGWWIGDWLTYGERRWGETYAQAAEELGYRVDTLRSYVWVARRFERDQRREDLSLAHHRAVASLPWRQRRSLLELAAANEWSAHETARRARQVRRNAAAIEAGATGEAVCYVGNPADAIAMLVDAEPGPPTLAVIDARQGSPETVFSTVAAPLLDAIFPACGHAYIATDARWSDAWDWMDFLAGWIADDPDACRMQLCGWHGASESERTYAAPPAHNGAMMPVLHVYRADARAFFEGQAADNLIRARTFADLCETLCAMHLKPGESLLAVGNRSGEVLDISQRHPVRVALVSPLAPSPVPTGDFSTVIVATEDF